MPAGIRQVADGPHVPQRTAGHRLRQRRSSFRPGPAGVGARRAGRSQASDRRARPSHEQGRRARARSVRGRRPARAGQDSGRLLRVNRMLQRRPAIAAEIRVDVHAAFSEENGVAARCAPPRRAASADRRRSVGGCPASASSSRRHHSSGGFSERRAGAGAGQAALNRAVAIVSTRRKGAWAGLYTESFDCKAIPCLQREVARRYGSSRSVIRKPRRQRRRPAFP